MFFYLKKVNICIYEQSPTVICSVLLVLLR